MGRIIDLSHFIENGMPVYPGDMETKVFKAKALGVDGYNDHRLETGMHSGTHIDSPMHLSDSCNYISDYPPDLFIGSGCVLDVRGQEIIEHNPSYSGIIKEKSIVLLYTGHDKLYGTEEYYKNHPCVSYGFCSMLVDREVKMLGIDGPSIDRYPFGLHKYLFKTGIFILENLTNLNRLLEADSFEVISLPLAIKADSSMTRAVARIL